MITHFRRTLEDEVAPGDEVKSDLTMEVGVPTTRTAYEAVHISATSSSESSPKTPGCAWPFGKS